MNLDNFASVPYEAQFTISAQRSGDEPLIEDLLDRTFGPERSHKTVYRLREGMPAVTDLSFVVLGEHDNLIASIRFWSVQVAGEAALLLGPLAVEPKFQGMGMGRALVAWGLKAAKQQEHRLCLVVGDPAYYAPYGFVPACPRGLILPGPVEPERFQLLELVVGAVEGLRGLVGRASEVGDTAGGAVA